MSKPHCKSPESTPAVSGPPLPQVGDVVQFFWGMVRPIAVDGPSLSVKVVRISGESRLVLDLENEAYKMVPAKAYLFHAVPYDAEGKPGTWRWGRALAEE